MSFLPPPLRAHADRIRRFVRFVELPVRGLAGLGAVSLLAACLDGIGIALLLPLLKAVIEHDLSPVTQSFLYAGFVRICAGEFWHHTGVILAGLALLSCTASIAHHALDYWAALITARLSRTTAHRLRLRIFGHYLAMGQVYFDRRSFGELQTLLADFTNDIGETGLYLREVVTRMLIVTVYVALMVTISWRLTLLLAALAPLYYLGVARLIRRIKSDSPRYTAARTALNQVIHRILPRLPLVRASSMLETETRRFTASSEELRRREQELDRKMQLVMPLQRVFLSLLLLVLVGVIYWLLQRHWVGVSGVLVYFFLVREIVNSMGVFAFFKATLSKVDGQIQAIRELSETQSRFVVRGGSRPFAGLRDAIHFRGLSFSYEGHPGTLHDVSFSIRRGERTALVGPSGSGKSTLVQLLLRHYPCPDAQVFVDDVDLNQLELGSLAAGISWVSQGILLFNDTLRHNLTYGLRRVGDAKLQDVIVRTQLAEVVARLPQGLDTQVGDDGVKLSGGERQRVSLARALLKDAPILILDEATNALDLPLEQRLQATTDAFMRGRTVLVIAHRFHAIRGVDQVVVMEAGRVVEAGPPAELLARDSRFRQLWSDHQLDPGPAAG